MSKKKEFRLDDEQKKLCSEMIDHFGNEVLSTLQIKEFSQQKQIPLPKFIFDNKQFAAGFGKYNLSVNQDIPVTQSVTSIAQAVNREFVKVKYSQNVTESLIPEEDKNYVPFGFYLQLKKIIESRIFYTVYITGLSGNGKTKMVEQLCAALNREFVRVNITHETDENDLIGTYELIDGNTVRREGPVINAMRRGAILLLDEVDLGTERLLCLQPILEGGSFLDKKTGELIHPKEGFNVIATANTKGKGNDDGRFIGTNTLNEAFLERFAITVEQEYPTERVEKNILKKLFVSLNIDDDEYIKYLVSWANINRKTFNDGGCDEVISTRRLLHIAKAYAIFKDRYEAVKLCLNRFDIDTKNSLFDLYTKIDLTGKKTTVLSVEEKSSLNENEDMNVASANGYSDVSTSNGKYSKIDSKELPKFASIQNQFDVSKKYGVPITIEFDQVRKDYVVLSHGKETRISTEALGRMSEKQEGEILDLLVASNQAKAIPNGPIVDIYRPIS